MSMNQVELRSVQLIQIWQASPSQKAMASNHEMLGLVDSEDHHVRDHPATVMLRHI
jgi:hypothetical protein